MIHVFTCEFCGEQQTAKRPSGRKPPRWCSMQCRTSGSRLTMACAECGNAFQDRRAEVAKGRRFCSRRCAWKNHRGAGNPKFRGGRRVASNGYIELLMPTHPRARANGYVYEHIVVAGQSVGRTLREDEVVHHKNGIKHDNRPENLAVMTRGQHTAHHARSATRRSRGEKGHA